MTKESAIESGSKEGPKEPELGPFPELDPNSLCMKEDERGNWDNQCEFFLSCLGYAVGLGNVWRFPYLCYKNGGALFLIPYGCMLLFAGLPMFFLEMALGQYASMGPNVLFANLSPIFSGLGWAMVMISTLTTIYYNMILAWTIFYMIASFTSVLPWSHCSNDFNSISCFTETASDACQVDNLHYFNHSCLTLDQYCQADNLTMYTNANNQSFCIEPSSRPQDKTDIHNNTILWINGTNSESENDTNWMNETNVGYMTGWMNETNVTEVIFGTNKPETINGTKKAELIDGTNEIKYSEQNIIEVLVKRIAATEEYFTNRMLGIVGKDWSNMGEMRWELVGCLFLAWVIVAACLSYGIQSSGKVVYFTALFPYAVLLVLFVRGITLEGAYKGIEFYLLKPNVSRLFEVEVWNDAATQIFYSSGVSFGGLMTLASYNKFDNNCMRDAIIIAACNCLSSVFAGFVIFSILGFLATELGVEVGDVVSSGSGLAFIVYPAAVTHMPMAALWSVLFFFMLLLIGLDTQFTMVETLISALMDQFPFLRRNKPLFVSCVCIVLFLMGLTMCLEGGMLMFELFNTYAAGMCLVICAILEVVVVNYVYGFKNFMKNITDEMGIYVPKFLYYYWAATWCFITPLSLGTIFGLSMYFVAPASFGDYVYPLVIQVLGWLLMATSVVIIPIGALFAYFRGDKGWRQIFESTPDFCPAHERKNRRLRHNLSFGIIKDYENQAFNGGNYKPEDGVLTPDSAPKIEKQNSTTL